MAKNFNYLYCFNKHVYETGLSSSISFDMPKGYENANGMYDSEKKILYINATLLKETPDVVKAFYLFHELRHAEQYSFPNRFDDVLRMALNYDIGYEGTCCKRVNGKWIDCHLDGGEEKFTALYLSQPHEIDANKFAYQKAKELYGDSEELNRLQSFWIPSHPIHSLDYLDIYNLIDKKITK